jgi:hypothetical protein
MSTTVIGTVRPSQLLWTYGPGALIDLPNLSVITLGLDRWDIDRCPPLEEARLLEAVRKVLGPQVARLRMAPVIADDDASPLTPEGKIGVPVRPFPRWMRCVRCGLLADFETNLFKLKEDLYRPDRTHFVHTSCAKGAISDAVPARFLLACRAGHLDDFPWNWFAHGGPNDCKGTLRFFERGASLQTENLWVKCEGCGSARSLVNAFGREAEKYLPRCRGRHPHLDRYDADCAESARTVLLGATNCWFPMQVSVLAIPHIGDSLGQLIEDGWEDLRELESEAELKGVLKSFVKRGFLRGIERYESREVWEAIDKRRKGGAKKAAAPDTDLKIPEWTVLTHPNPPTDWPHFLSEKVEAPAKFKKQLKRVLLLKRLREVNALVGYTRVESSDETADPDERPTMAPLSFGRPTWVPANEVHGEGIFLEFDEEAILKWEKGAGVPARTATLMAGHRGWRNARKLDPDKGFPGIRHAMLHTLSHLLIRELALECGYNAASIRERIYASTGDETPMAGVLLYTAAADSDGTLGGLIELGKPENLGRLIEQALKRAAICSSDPLCSEHNPEKDRTLHNASCHACAFVAETSCEMSNRYLDRALLVKTFDCETAQFF